MPVILRERLTVHGTINFEGGLLRMTYFNTWSAFSKLELLRKQRKQFFIELVENKSEKV